MYRFDSLAVEVSARRGSTGLLDGDGKGEGESDNCTGRDVIANVKAEEEGEKENECSC